jgi:hypothetical protein
MSTYLISVIKKSSEQMKVKISSSCDYERNVVTLGPVKAVHCNGLCDDDFNL